MINKSDLIFVLVSFMIIILSYYWMVIRRPDSKNLVQEIREHQNENQQAMNPLNSDNEQNDKPKTKAEIIKEARKREKKAAKDVN